MNALIVGPRHVGKSTLIRRVLQALNLNACGFETVKEDGLADDRLGSPIYIYDCGTPHVQTEENLVGYCKNEHPSILTGAFNRYADHLRAMPMRDIVVLDELGFLESSAKEFQSAILEILDGDVPVIAAVKDKSTDFLDAVKSHSSSRCFYIDADNRERLFDDVLAFVRSQL